MSLGQRIRLALARKGLTISEAARRLGITQPTLHVIVTGRKPGWKQLPRIAELLDVSVEWLTSGQPEPDWLADLDPQVIAQGPVVKHAPTISDRPRPYEIPYVGVLSGADPDRPRWIAAEDRRRAPLRVKPHWRAVYVHGNTAHPLVWDRQTVLVDDEVPVKPGRLVVAYTADGACHVKRFIEERDGLYFLAGLDGGRNSLVLAKEDTRLSVVVSIVFTDSVA